MSNSLSYPALLRGNPVATALFYRKWAGSMLSDEIRGLRLPHSRSVVVEYPIKVSRAVKITAMLFLCFWDYSDKWRDELERNGLSGGWVIEVRGRACFGGGVVDDNRWLVGWWECGEGNGGGWDGSSGYDEVWCACVWYI